MGALCKHKHIPNVIGAMLGVVVAGKVPLLVKWPSLPVDGVWPNEKVPEGGNNEADGAASFETGLPSTFFLLFE